MMGHAGFISSTIVVEGRLFREPQHPKEMAVDAFFEWVFRAQSSRGLKAGYSDLLACFGTAGFEPPCPFWCVDDDKDDDDVDGDDADPN